MPKPLTAGTRGASTGGLFFLYGRPQQPRRLSSSKRSLLLKEQESLHKTWNAVIQFSALHLFCPAHARAHTQATTSVFTASPFNRMHGTRTGGNSSYSHLFIARSATSSSFCGQNYMITSRGAAGLVSRKLSATTPIGVASNHNISLARTYSTGYSLCHEALEDVNFTREPIDTTSTLPNNSASGSRSRSGSKSGFLASKEKTLSPFENQSNSLSKKVDNSREHTIMPESLNQSNTKQSSSSWSFPTSNNFNHNPLEPVQSWTSTANALAELYKSFRELASPPSKANRSVILHRALKHYNYLSRLQSMYDTVLVSRRHTRNLFLLQSREEKTRENLDQLLKITVDLIRLNERDRQKRRSKQSKLGSMSSSGAESSATMVSNNSGQHPHVNSPTDKYHGLRLSEYTVLMNWIGSVNNTQLSSPASQMRLTAKSPFSQSSMALTDLTHHYRHPIASSGPVDQVWAIWQDFLLTGMKPDIVLYTMVIDVLLKARDYNRADQVWNHMQCQGLDHPFENNERKNALGVRSGTAELGSIKSMHGISLHDNITRATKLPFSLLSSIKKHSSLLSMNSDATLTITPNLQTLSVLIQPLVQQSNIKGVERLHKTVIPNDQQQQRPINTVLVNQILQTLIDLGETTAAREIYAEMRNNSDCSQTEPLNMGDSSNTKRLKDTQSSPSNEGPGLLSNPIHHQTSSRRKTWKRQAQKQFLLSNSAYRPQAPLSPSTGLSIRPNETTYKLMLRVARNEKDLELEDQILKEMQCLSLSPSMLDY